MKRRFLVALALMMVGLVARAAVIQEPALGSPFRVLLVDGTKTLASTMRIVALAGGIRQSGVAELTVMFADNLGPFDDPVAAKPIPEAPYDLVIIVPRGIDDGTASRIWILVAGDPQANPVVAQAIELLRQGIDRAFAGIAEAVGPLDDLWAALTASLYVQEGWLQ